MKTKHIAYLIKFVERRNQIPSLLDLLKYKTICEIGVEKGRHLDRLARINPVLLVGVDTWDVTDIAFYDNPLKKKERQYQGVMKWANKQNFDIRIIRDYSVKASLLFDDETFDFIYIDADHSYEAVRDDIAAWWPKVKQKGILGGHDYKIAKSRSTQIEYGVIRAVDEFRKKEDLQFFHTTKDRMHSFFLIKGM